MEYLALFDYRPLDIVEQLPFQKGDRLIILSQDSPGWWKARDAIGRQGLVPQSYLCRPDDQGILEKKQQEKDSKRGGKELGNSPSQRFPLQPDETVVEALFHYESKDPSHLSFKRGDLITVLEKKPGGWWRGKIRGSNDGESNMFGLFNRGFVQFRKTLE